MAKSPAVWYQVTDKSDLTYNGKTVGKGSVVSDIPGESIGWLLSNGNITSVTAPSDGKSVIAPTTFATLQAKFAEARAAKTTATASATPPAPRPPTPTPAPATPDASAPADTAPSDAPITTPTDEGN